MLVGSLILTCFLVLSVLALAFGEDSRDSATDPRLSTYLHGLR
jgi:hypothetical protein